MVDRSESGVFNVNHQWATSIRYYGRMDDGKLAGLHVRFRNDDNIVAIAKLTREQALEVLGKKNLDVIERSAKDAAGPGKEGSNESFQGELRGRNLEFRRVILPGYKERSTENAIALDSTVQRSKGAASATDAASMRTTNGAPVEREPTGPAGDGTSFKTISDYHKEDARKRRTVAIPDEVAQRFLHMGDKYYFPDKTLAFTDLGTRLKAETENQEVVRSLIAIAQEREWEGVRVSGTNNFRRQVWREATLQGLGVKGYQPSELERVERELAKRYPPSELAHDPSKRQTADPERTADGVSELLREPQETTHRSASDPVQDKVLIGTLVAHGAAKYKFDEKNADSYYVRIATPSGEKTRWGIDLERAIRESKSHVAIGDTVYVHNQGSRPVTVKVDEKDSDGKVISHRELSTHRNTWLVEKKERIDELEIKARASRNGQTAKQELVNCYPDLASAIATVRVAELFAQKNLETTKEREAFVGLMRDALASRIARDEEIPEIKLRERVVKSADYAAEKATERAADRTTKQIGTRALTPTR